MTVKVNFKSVFFHGLWKNGKFITRFAMNFLPRWRGDGYWDRAVALGEQVELGWGVGSLLKIVHDLSLQTEAVWVYDVRERGLVGFSY